MRSCRCLFFILVMLTGCIFTTGVLGDDQESAVPSVMKLLQSGRVPSARLGAIVEQIARRGNEFDLAYLYNQADHMPEYEGALRLHVYRLLVEAATTRNTIPAGDLSRIAGILEDPQFAATELRLTAIRLAGLWKVTEAIDALTTVIQSDRVLESERQAALTALTLIGGPASREILTGLAQEGPVRQRALAIAALVGLDLGFAATQAAQILQQMTEKDDPSPIIGAFLDREGGSARLATAISENPPSEGVAMLSLRHMYSIGRSDEELATVLGRVAGIETDPKPLDPHQVALVADRVASDGDPVRGEAVFRRADLACMKCHAVSKAGGQVGPDLSPLGASSPADYIINSISNPDQQIKEAFTTRVVITADGLVHQGIVVDRDDRRLILKDAKGVEITIPVADIEEEVEGKSLMPKGLMKFMTDSEFIDLVKFLSLLGRPGTEYAIRQTPRMQRWRVYGDVPEALRKGSADESAQEDYLAGDVQLVPAYSRVNGDLPLDELATPYGPVLYLAGELDVTQAGEVGLRIDSAEGVSLSVGTFSSTAPECTLQLDRGRHTILLRVDTRARQRTTLRLEAFRVPGSTAEFEVVDGD